MPIYEYLCQDCRKRSSILVLNLRNPPPVSCCLCGSSKLDRLLSRFAAPKSEEARLESLADPGNFGGLDENDPQSYARMMKKMGEEMGEDVGDDMEAMMDQAGDEGDITDDTDLE
ncbi:MAG TPA: FmdB family zinc ribbon protein [Nitrospiraceae bacterium]|nr:FmdB family zinc ribbon protein [Nitrospiraceae bacterium]